jgi:hypothetical protein
VTGDGVSSVVVYEESYQEVRKGLTKSRSFEREFRN